MVRHFKNKRLIHQVVCEKTSREQGKIGLGRWGVKRAEKNKQQSRPVCSDFERSATHWQSGHTVHTLSALRRSLTHCALHVQTLQRSESSAPEAVRSPSPSPVMLILRGTTGGSPPRHSARSSEGWRIRPCGLLWWLLLQVLFSLLRNLFVYVLICNRKKQIELAPNGIT